MTDTFTFPNTDAGAEQRTRLAIIMNVQGRECTAFTETWVDGKQSTTVLRLNVSKRPDEGQIAAAMKARKP
jgi:hypothetical protein